MEELSRASGRVLLEHTTVIAGRGLRIRDRAKLEFQPRHMARHRCRWKDAQWWDSRLKKPWKNSKKGKPWKCSCFTTSEELRGFGCLNSPGSYLRCFLCFGVWICALLLLLLAGTFLRQTPTLSSINKQDWLWSCQEGETMFCRNQTARATVARGSALEMEIRRGKFRKSVFLDTSQVQTVCQLSTHARTHTLRVFTAVIDLSASANSLICAAF